MQLGTLPLHSANLLNQDLIGSGLDHTAVLNNDSGLALGTIRRATTIGNRLKAKLEKLPIGPEIGDLDQIAATKLVSSSTSGATLDIPNLSGQRHLHKYSAPHTSGYETLVRQGNSVQDPLTGLAEGAPLVNAQAVTKINFQPNTAPVPAGYLKDSGQAYNDTRNYGWVRQASLGSAIHVPLDITPNARDRNQPGVDQRLDTLLHMQYPSTIHSSTVKTPAAWEYDLPKGVYKVTVSVGDQPNSSGVYDSQHTIRVEGVKAIDRFQSNAAQKYKQTTVEVSVSDGRLTIDAIGGINTKINYVDIASVSLSSPTTPFNWNTAAPSPIGRGEAQGVMVNGKLYVFGGFVNQSYQTTTRADVYDPAMNKWTRIANVPEPLTHSAVAVDGKTIYLIGGYVGKHPGPSTNHVWKYSIPTNTWSSAPSLPAVRGAGAAALLGRELHFFGGATRTAGQLDETDRGNHYVLSLDSKTNWSSLASLPNPRNHLAGVTLHGRIYAIGGQHQRDEVNGNQGQVDIYNPATNAWTRAASLPAPRGHISSSTFVMNNRINVIGGTLNGDKPSADVTTYNPKTNTWTKLRSLPAGRKSPVAGVIGERIIVTTGNPGFQTTTWTSIPANN